MWLFKKMYRKLYSKHFLETKIKEHHAPKKKYEPSLKCGFPFRKFSSERTLSMEYFAELYN
jgi:hypothetical protein